MNVRDALNVDFKELMSEKVSGRYDIIASINNASQNILQAPSLRPLHLDAALAFQYQLY